MKIKDAMKMNKREFDKALYSKWRNVTEIRAVIWNGYDNDNNNASWLDVLVVNEEFDSIYVSDYAPEGEKELYKMQKQWINKIKKWLGPYSDIKVVAEELNV